MAWLNTVKTILFKTACEFDKKHTKWCTVTEKRTMELRGKEHMGHTQTIQLKGSFDDPIGKTRQKIDLSHFWPSSFSKVATTALEKPQTSLCMCNLIKYT